MVAQTLFSSGSREWGTPPELFNELNWLYQFNADLAASHKNHLLENYYYNELKIVNGRAGYKQRQRSLLDELSFWQMRGFMNPPYGEPEKPCKPDCKKSKCTKRGWHTDVLIPGIGDFIEHVHGMVRINKGRAFAVLLLPARTDTRWWHEYIAPCRIYGGVEEIPGRLKFLVNGNATNPAPFPSVKVLIK